MVDMRTCGKCGKTVTKKWFKEHVKRHESTKDICNTRHHHTVMVDQRKGLFASSRNLSGPFAPVHLIKLTSGKESGITCESTTCYQAQLAAKRGGDLSFECPHARSTPYAKPGISYILTQESLEYCVASGTITQEKADTVMQMKAESDVEDTPLVVMLPMPETSTSTVIHMSVFARNIRYWSKFKRTVVTFNKQQKAMACRCCRQKVSCSHKVAGIWFLAQEMPEILSSNFYFEELDEEFHDAEISNNTEDQGEDQNDDNEKTRYLMSEKTYPVFKNHQVPDVRTVTEIVPAEEECCNNRLTTHLVHRQGKVIARDAIIKGKKKR